MQVKKGQTLAFIEQLGTHWPLEAPQVRLVLFGDSVEFLVSEGAPPAALTALPASPSFLYTGGRDCRVPGLLCSLSAHGLTTAISPSVLLAGGRDC